MSDALCELILRHMLAAEAEAAGLGFPSGQVAACIFSHGLGSACRLGVPVEHVRSSVDEMYAQYRSKHGGKPS